VSPFIAWPWLALAPAVVFAWLYQRSRQRAGLVTAVAWAAYAVYELGMQRRWLCTGECNIRVDLLLLYPVLLVLTFTALVRCHRRRGPVSRADSSPRL
jgi:hypothetical protein